MSMKKILLIGAGNIGKRHFESIYNYKNFFFLIHVIDKSKFALKEIKKNNKISDKNIRLENNYNNLDFFYDLVIIATNSFEREKIIDTLLKKITFNFIILEKIVFQKIKSYNKYVKIFDQKKIKCWVNCPNRTFKSYLDLKKNIKKNNNLIMVVSGGNWGLASNFVHYTDLFCFLINSTKLKIDLFNIDDKINKSKRKGFIDFNGLIVLKSKNNHYLFLQNSTSNNFPNIKIFQNNFIFNFNENEKFAFLEDLLTKKIKKIKFIIPYQSETTIKYCLDIFEKNNCGLSTLNEHTIINKELLEYFLSFYKKNKNKKINILPIT